MSNFLYNLFYHWLNEKDAHRVSCCICLGKYEQETKSTFTLNGATFEIRQCNGDDLMYLYPQPGKEYREKLYNHPSYFSGTDDMYGLSLDDEKAKSIAAIRIKEIQNYAPEAKSLLEIGSAAGHLLEAAKASGFKTVEGIEFSDAAAKICRKKGINVILADINGRFGDRIKNTYDVIAAYSVLEHLENPAQFLDLIKKFLKRDGLLVIRIPDTDPKQGPKISLLDHFWHFTRKSVVTMFKKNSFKIIDIFESGTFHSKQYGINMANITIIVSL